MNASGDRQEDVLSIYLAGEKQAIDNGADDITIGKFKLFAGHCYKSLGKKSEAKARYDEARPLFEKYKDHKIVQIANEATRWLSELENCYLAVKT